MTDLGVKLVALGRSQQTLFCWIFFNSEVECIKGGSPQIFEFPEGLTSGSGPYQQNRRLGNFYFLT